MTDILREPIPVKFSEEDHVYHHVPSGRLFPGCTTVLRAAQKPWLAPWMLKEAIEYIRGEWEEGKTYSATARDAILDAGKKAHKRTSGEAKSIGSDAHALIEDAVAKRMKRYPALPHVKPDTEALAAFAAWEAWDAKVKPEYLLSEEPVCSVLHWYAGKLDLLVRINGKVLVVDVKTSKSVYSENFVQLEAYRTALSEWTDLKIDGRAVLRCPKDGSPHEFVEAPYSKEADLEYFLSCLAIHRYNQRVEADRVASRV